MECLGIDEVCVFVCVCVRVGVDQRCYYCEGFLEDLLELLKVDTT